MIKRFFIALSAISFLLACEKTTSSSKQAKEKGLLEVKGVLFTYIEDYADQSSSRTVIRVEDQYEYTLVGLEGVQEAWEQKNGESLGRFVEIHGHLLDKDTIQVIVVHKDHAAAMLHLAAPVDTISKPVYFVLNIGRTANDVAAVRAAATEISQAYSDSSYGQKVFDNDADGDGEIDVFFLESVQGSTASCDYNQWAAQADQAAEQQGIDLSRYNHKVYVYQARCGWAGLATVDCLNFGRCQAWVSSNQAIYPEVTFHELGHNLGLGHAATQTAEYGDASDAMGRASFIHFNAPHTDILGWFDQTPMAVREPVYERESLDIYAMSYDVNEQKTHALKYPTGRGEGYYVSYRTNDGLDQNIPRQYTSGLSVHALSGLKTIWIQLLEEGETWTSPDGTLSVTAKAGSSSEYMVADITYANGESSPQPEILAQPKAPNFQLGDDVSLEVEVEGGDLAYQWSKDGEDLRGEQSRELKISNVTLKDLGFYQVSVSDGITTLYSDRVLLRDSEALELAVNVQPLSASLSRDMEHVLKVEAVGTGELHYQWFHNGSALEDEDAAEFEISKARSRHVGEYYVVVKDISGEIKSKTADIDVLDFKITTLPVTQKVDMGSKAVFELEIDGEDIEVQWRQDKDKVSSSEVSLEIENVSKSDLGAYYADISHDSGDMELGPFFLLDKSDPGMKVVYHPQHRKLTQGDSVVLDPVIEGGAAPTYQWYKDGQEMVGETKTNLTLESVSESDEGFYILKAEDEFGKVESQKMQVTVAEEGVYQTVHVELKGSDDRVVGLDFAMLLNGNVVHAQPIRSVSETVYQFDVEISKDHKTYEFRVVSSVPEKKDSDKSDEK